MTDDKRQTWGLIIDVLDVLEKHGYHKADDQHTGRAVGLIGDLAHIYEGSREAPAGAYLVPMPHPRQAGPDQAGPAAARPAEAIDATGMPAKDAITPARPSRQPAAGRTGNRRQPEAVPGKEASRQASSPAAHQLDEQYWPAPGEICTTAGHQHLPEAQAGKPDREIGLDHEAER